MPKIKKSNTYRNSNSWISKYIRLLTFDVADSVPCNFSMAHLEHKNRNLALLLEPS